MRINVRTLEGESVTLDVQPNDTIRNVKKKIQSAKRIRAQCQRLVFGEVQLKNSKLLSNYGIQDDATISLILRVVQDDKTIAGGYGEGDAADQLSYPYGLVIDDDQTMIIADWGNHRIVQWKIDERNGKVIAGGHGEGSEPNQLSYPTDVVIDRQNNNIIICDRGNRRVVQWSRAEGTTQGQVLIDHIDCWGLAIDHERNLYVSDIEKHDVKRYVIGNPNGTVVAGGNGRGIGLNQLSQPSYLFVTPQQTLYISDTWNHRVMKWERDAREGTIFGRGFSRGIAIDATGNIYVADYGNHQLIRMPVGANESTIIAIGNKEKEEEENQLYYPWGLTLDQQGRIYVTDHLNHRIQRFPTT
ncbi:unnamed protein product [Adineta ricciae]|uniref:Ubiquitin-like domain-containing protein n=1 Tax=Adineta ricciae TaxID=249248 RepID=A0A814ZIL0_ADIRI|nr:unnamed protein product [Adineta ricciae]CAF1243621.1 unnamed protein product [Adineta ricciae]